MNTDSIAEVENHAGYSVVRFFGFIDAATVDRIRPVVNAKLSADCARIVIDLQQVGFIDSHGIGFFVSLMKKAHSRGGRLFFVGAVDQPASVLNMVGFNNTLVTYCTDMQQALAAVTQAA